MRHDKPFRSAGFWVGEGLLVGAALLWLVTLADYFVTAERTTCAVASHAATDVDDIDASTVICPAPEAYSGTRVTVYADGDHVHTGDDFVDWGLQGLVFLFAAVIWPLARRARWSHAASEEEPTQPSIHQVSR
jgi:hypothetical protein